MPVEHFDLEVENCSQGLVDKYGIPVLRMNTGTMLCIYIYMRVSSYSKVDAAEERYKYG